jgi:hypothetical protein
VAGSRKCDRGEEVDLEGPICTRAEQGDQASQGAGMCWVISEVMEEGRRKTARCGQARSLYTPPKQRRARACTLPNAGPSVS